MPEFFAPIVEWLSPLWENPSSFFNFDFLPKYWFYFQQGIIYTLLLSVVSVLLAVVPALLLALMRLSKNKFLRGLSGAYIAIFRSTPLLVQLSLVYFGLFSAIQIPNVTLFGFLKLSIFIPCVTALALNSSAYVAEIFRAGIQAVPVGQHEAAEVLGFTKTQTFFKIVFPQMVKRVVPPVTNEVITLVKDTSMAFAIAYAEMFTMAKQVAAQQSNIMPLFVAGLFYYIFNIIVAWVMGRIEKKLSYFE